MGRWGKFLDSINTDGGHIVLLTLFTGFGVLIMHYDMMIGSNIATGSFSALLMKITHAGSNKDQQPHVTNIQATEVKS